MKLSMITCPVTGTIGGYTVTKYFFFNDMDTTEIYTAARLRLPNTTPAALTAHRPLPARSHLPSGSTPRPPLPSPRALAPAWVA